MCPRESTRDYPCTRKRIHKDLPTTAAEPAIAPVSPPASILASALVNPPATAPVPSHLQAHLPAHLPAHLLAHLLVFSGLYLWFVRTEDFGFAFEKKPNSSFLH